MTCSISLFTLNAGKLNIVIIDIQSNRILLSLNERGTEKHERHHPDTAVKEPCPSSKTLKYVM